MPKTKPITRDDILCSAKRLAAQTGGMLSRGEFTRQTGISSYFIYRHFPDRGWKDVEELAGLRKHRGYNTRISEDALLKAFHQAASELGEIPSGAQLHARGAPCLVTYNKRFGPLPQILARYESWLNEHAPDSPLLAQLQTRDKSKPRARGRRPRVAVRNAAALSSSPLVPTEWPKRAGVEFGAPLNFRSLRHEPTSELGVVYLFGMLSDQLGLIVESLQPGFPDCEAKRLVDMARNRWQRVRIEFEYASHNFHEHHHDPKRCDMIVCWIHDWPDCPLEVVELRAVVGQMGKEVGSRE